MATPTLLAPAGQRTVVVTRNHSSMITPYAFKIEPANPGDTLAGQFEVKASRWILPGVPKLQPLQPLHEIHAGMWATFFQAAVIPTVDVIVTRVQPGTGGEQPLRSFHGGNKKLLVLAIAVLVISAAVAFVLLAQSF